VSRSLIKAALVLSLLGWGCEDLFPEGINEQFGFSALIFVSRAPPPNASSLALPDGPRPGGNLLMLKPAAPGGKVIRLTDFAAGDVLGIDVAPDGSSLLAAMRCDPGDRFHLYRFDLEEAERGGDCFTAEGDLGPACTRLTFGPADDTRPLHLPDGRYAFVRSDPDGLVDMSGRGRARVLVAVEPDGSGLVRLDMGPGDTLGAGIQADGWLQLVRWTEREGQPMYLPFRADPTGAASIAPDGPGLQDVPLGPLFFQDAGDRLAACVPPAGTWGAGTICRRGDGAWSDCVVAGIPTGSGCSPEGRVRDPFRLQDGRFLVSYANVPGGCLNNQDGDRGLAPDFSLAVLDPWSGKRTPVYNRPQSAEVCPRPVVERSIPDPGIGVGSCPEGGVRFEGFVGAELLGRGVVRVRVLEGISGAIAPWMMEIGGYSVGAVCAGDSDADTLVDTWEAPVQADGSFRVRAPSGVPLKLQVLDRYGAVLAADPVWRGGPPCAVRRCGGCHVNDGTADGFEVSTAGRSDPVRLDAPAGDQLSIDFRRDIQPILDRTCVRTGCHDAETASGVYVTLAGSLRGLNLSDSPSGRTMTSYRNLLFHDIDRDSRNGKIIESRRAYVVPGNAAGSRLAQRLGIPCRWDCNDQPAWAPWGLSGDDAHQSNDPALTDADRWRIVEWIDAGAPFLGRGATP
jgi:hypothetical protein